MGSSYSFVSVNDYDDIKEHVHVVLDLETPTYTAWRTYFGLLFASYCLHDRIDGRLDAHSMKA